MNAPPWAPGAVQSPVRFTAITHSVAAPRQPYRPRVHLRRLFAPVSKTFQAMPGGGVGDSVVGWPSASQLAGKIHQSRLANMIQSKNIITSLMFETGPR